MSRRVQALVLFAMCAIAPSAHGGPFFGELGDLPGGDEHSIPFDLSYDGRVVVGMGTIAGDGQRPFRWTAETGMVALNGYENRRGWAEEISADGAVIVGRISSNPHEAFRWTAETGIVLLGSGGAISGWALAVSGDGQVIGGIAGTHPVIWTEQQGWNSISRNGYVFSLSTDGSVGVGRHGGMAFRWTADGGVQDLGDLPGGPVQSDAIAVSADGSIAVGRSYISDTVRRAFRWTEQEGMVALAHWGGEDSTTSANDISADGSLIAGDGSGQALLWKSDGSVHALADLLIAQGRTDAFVGWSSTITFAMSGDGRVVVGNGTDPDGNWSSAWLARTSEADVNSDWVVDIFDVNVVSDNWGTTGPTGDVNGDGTVDIFDVNAISEGWSKLPTAGAIVPEPATWTMLAIGVAATLRRRSSRVCESETLLPRSAGTVAFN